MEEPIIYNPKYVEVGGKIWSAENLNVSDGRAGYMCLDGKSYYTHTAACRIADAIDGWHLPTREDWEKLCKDLGGYFPDYHGMSPPPGKIYYMHHAPLKVDPMAIPLDGYVFSGSLIGYKEYARLWTADLYKTYRGTKGGLYILDGTDNVDFDVACISDYCSVRLIKD